METTYELELKQNSDREIYEKETKQNMTKKQWTKQDMNVTCIILYCIVLQ